MRNTKKETIKLCEVLTEIMELKHGKVNLTYYGNNGHMLIYTHENGSTKQFWESLEIEQTLGYLKALVYNNLHFSLQLEKEIIERMEAK
jgi:hypothetical protein